MASLQSREKKSNQQSKNKPNKNKSGLKEVLLDKTGEKDIEQGKLETKDKDASGTNAKVESFDEQLKKLRHNRHFDDEGKE